jgi:allantoin racemase
MRQLLVINPNTSVHVSALLQAHAQAAAGLDVQVRTVTAQFGAPYIACEASYAVAAHALLDRWASALQEGQPAPDAVLIGCFGDPGLFALRLGSQAPVTGLAEASFHAAAQRGPFAVVTGGEPWKPMLERLAYSLGHASALAGIHTVVPSGAALASDPEAAIELLSQACREAAERWQVGSVVLGGAGLAGMAAAVQPHVPVPVIDSVQAGTRHALAQAATALPKNGFAIAWEGVSDALAALGDPGQSLSAQGLIKKGERPVPSQLGG